MLCWAAVIVCCSMVKVLSDEQWTEVPIQHVHLAYLRAEASKLDPSLQAIGQALMTAPDLSGERDNNARQQILYTRRALVMEAIPNSTTWYEVQHLQRACLGELLVIGRCGWDDPRDRNELLRVKLRKPIVLRGSPAEWSPPILWGHNRSGPFTILEGNHRLVAYASSKAPPELQVPVFVGISDDVCVWHLPDPWPP